MTPRPLHLLLLLPLISLQSCVLKANHDEVVAKNLRCDADLAGTAKERDQLRSKLDEAQKQLSDTESRNEELSQTNQMLAGKNSEFSKRSIDTQKELLKLKKEEDERTQREAATAKQIQEAFQKSLASEVDQKLLALINKPNSLTVSISDRALFQTGSDQLSSSGKKLLGKIGSELRNLKDRHVLVDAYVDGGATVKGVKSKYPSAWEFSSIRAVRVARFLDEEGVDGARLSASGNSAQPNRRIDLILTPLR